MTATATTATATAAATIAITTTTLSTSRSPSTRRSRRTLHATRELREVGKMGSRGGAGINLVVLRELVALDDDQDPDFSSNLIREFFALAEKVILSIIYDLTSNDLSRMPTHTHQLCDSSSAMGFVEFNEISQKLQAVCQADENAELTSVWTIVRALKAEKQRLHIELRNLYLKPATNPMICADVLGKSSFG